MIKWIYNNLKKYRILLIKEKLLTSKKLPNNNCQPLLLKRACFKDSKVFFQNLIKLKKVQALLVIKIHKLSIFINRIKTSSYLYLKMKNLFSKILIWIKDFLKLVNLTNSEKFQFLKTKNYQRILLIKY
jgi:hypothetical protein